MDNYFSDAQVDSCAQRNNRMEPSSMKNVFDESDSIPQVELSSKYLAEPMSLNPSYRRSYVHPLYQYPYAEWVPNSICYAEKSARSKTFEKWPKQMKPSAMELIDAGFFYKGYGDSVQCFFCGICLHDWETKDNAMKEHRRWSRSCKFIDMISFPG